MAVTLWTPPIITVQSPVPVQSPVQPAKVEPVAAVAVRVTLLPYEKLAPHVPPQSIPAGLLVTVPDPVPAFVTLRAKGCRVKVAVTLRAAVMATMQLPVPVQSPPQPMKVEPVVGVAVRVTLLP